jgi:hypothetical protein
MTEAELNARRQNAQHSPGPRTPEGKKRSSLNAFRHGLTGQIVLQTPEDEQAFKKYCDGIREALAPVGALELDLAQAIAEDRWRLNRARAIENSIFALDQSEYSPEEPGRPEVDAAIAQGRTWMAHAHQLHLLTTYENRIRRSVEKNTAELRALQAERKAAIAKAQEEAEALVALAEAEGGDYDPADDFPPESSPLGSFFQDPPSSVKLSVPAASFAPSSPSWRTSYERKGLCGRCQTTEELERSGRRQQLHRGTPDSEPRNCHVTETS